jgi:hypothetical protein
MFIDGVPSFTASTALEARRLVKIDTGVTGEAPAQIKYCGVTGIPQAITQYSGASGDLIAVDLFPQKEGMFEVEVTISTAIVCGTTLYPLASGILTDHYTTNAYAVAVAIQVAAASGDHIGIIPLFAASFVTG